MYKNGFWVFGYGSLLWKPGFEYSIKKQAQLNGFRRTFCMYSTTYRGTVENPGLVLALDPLENASCQGMAFFVPPKTAKATHAYLQERELVTSAYIEQSQTVTLEDGQVVDAVCYIIDQNHCQYTGEICLNTQADIIATSSGNTGPNWEYLYNTASYLAKIGIKDTDMENLVDMVKARRLVQG